MTPCLDYRIQENFLNSGTYPFFYFLLGKMSVASVLRAGFTEVLLTGVVKKGLPLGWKIH
jgi:hypothetical protein